ERALGLVHLECHPGRLAQRLQLAPVLRPPYQPLFAEHVGDRLDVHPVLEAEGDPTVVVPAQHCFALGLVQVAKHHSRLWRSAHEPSVSLRVKPTPRTVWMSGMPAASCSLRRRLPTCTSTTLLSGSKCMSQTFSSRVVRRTTSSRCSRKCSSSWNSLGVSSSGWPSTVTTWRSRSSSTGPALSSSTRAAPPRRPSARMRASSSSNRNGLAR